MPGPRTTPRPADPYAENAGANAVVLNHWLRLPLPCGSAIKFGLKVLPVPSGSEKANKDPVGVDAAIVCVIVSGVPL